MWNKIKVSFKKDVWGSLGVCVVLTMVITMIGAIIGLAIWEYHQPETAVIQTRNGPVAKTYYGSIDSVTAQQERDEAIARAEMEGKSPEEARAIGQSEYDVWMQPSDFHIMEALYVLPLMALILPFAFLRNTRRWENQNEKS